LKLLPDSYYTSSDILHLSQDLLGKIIVSDIDEKRTTARIVETEAYRAPEDRGSHAFGNNRTQRTEIMFGNGGAAYVYLCYGIHHLCNVVTGRKDQAHAILIRAIEPIDGIEVMLERRKFEKLNHNLTNGPGKWTQAMGIKREHTGVQYYSKKSPVRIYDGESVGSEDTLIGKRVGIAYAQAWSHMPWRYRIKENQWTSKPEEVNY